MNRLFFDPSLIGACPGVRMISSMEQREDVACNFVSECRAVSKDWLVQARGVAYCENGLRLHVAVAVELAVRLSTGYSGS